MVKISVVMPTYNHRHFIEFAVNSLLSQTFRNFELIIVNNGSTDGTADYLNSLADPRVVVVHQENRGAIRGITRGVQMARGEFLTWVSSDNIAAPYFLEALLQPLEKYSDVGFSYSAYYRIDDRNRVLSLQGNNLMHYRDLVFNRNSGSVAFLYRRSLHDQVGGYDESFRYSGDTEMWSRFFRVCRTAYVIEPTHYYRIHDGQETQEAVRTNAFSVETPRIINKYWNETMKGNISNVISDIYPRMSGDDYKNNYFRAVWSLAAHLMYYLEIPGAVSLLRVCMHMMPPENLIDGLHFLCVCLGHQPLPGAVDAMAAALAANPSLDQHQAVGLLHAMTGATRLRRPDQILSLPWRDGLEGFEREPSLMHSFMGAALPALPSLA